MPEKAPQITIKGISQSPATNVAASPPGSISRSRSRSEDSGPDSALLRLLEYQISNSASKATATSTINPNPTPTSLHASASTSTRRRPSSALPDTTPRGPKAMIDFENRSRSAANRTTIQSDGRIGRSPISDNRGYPHRSRKRDLGRGPDSPAPKKTEMGPYSPSPRARHVDSMDHYSPSRRYSSARSIFLTPPRYSSPQGPRSRSPAPLPDRSARHSQARDYYRSSRDTRSDSPEKLPSIAIRKKTTPIELFPRHKSLSSSPEKKKYQRLSSVSIPKMQDDWETTVCYNCTGKGHSFMDCKAACGKCGKAGHKTIECGVLNKIKKESD